MKSGSDNIPSLNFWEGTGTRIREVGQLNPSNALARSSVVLLVHGYNNKLNDASASYSQFVKSLNGNLPHNFMGVYWPGASWSGPLYYMEAVEQAKKVAPRLALQLFNAARQNGILTIDIVAHSLGCRLVLETVRELIELRKTHTSISGLTIRKVVFMAGAVPTRYLEDLQRLRGALESINSALSLYSEADKVLHLAFPAGQTAAGEGFFPIALGRRHWPGASARSAMLKQDRNAGAGHSDYWTPPPGTDRSNCAATKVAAFLSLDRSPSRSPAVRHLPPGRQQPLRKIILHDN